jgi:transcriptional activator protein UGA3
MAMESPALRHSLLALASSHISLADTNYRVAAIEAQNNALAHQKMSIVSMNRNACWSKDNAATCLVLATSLITTGDCKGWYIHMEGAKQFILATGGSQPSGGLPLPLLGIEGMKRTSEGRWVLRNFAYHDILGSITLRRRPLLEPSYLDDICHDTDSYMGPGTILLKYIAQVQILNIETQADPRDKNFYDKWTQIENDLNNWMCPGTVDADLISMVLAYRSVGLILLYRVVRKQVKTQLAHDKKTPSRGKSGEIYGLETLLDVLESRMSFQVAETMRHVSTITVWSAPEAGILFPLFIAGAESRSEQQMGLIMTRLQQSLAKRMFRNIELALETLEIMWGRRLTADSGEMDWELILGEISCELVLT